MTMPRLWRYPVWCFFLIKTAKDCIVYLKVYFILQTDSYNEEIML